MYHYVRYLLSWLSKSYFVNFSVQFLPAKRVKEKAKKLRRYISEDMLAGTTSRNILAMTFRQVVLQQLYSFELVVFRHGSERNMEDLENPIEVCHPSALSSYTLASASILHKS